MLRSVDLPEPEAPTTATSSPRSIRRLTFRRATTSTPWLRDPPVLYTLVTPSSWIKAESREMVALLPSYLVLTHRFARFFAHDLDLSAFLKELYIHGHHHLIPRRHPGADLGQFPVSKASNDLLPGKLSPPHQEDVLFLAALED